MSLSVCFSTYLPTYLPKGILGQNQDVVESSPKHPIQNEGTSFHLSFSCFRKGL